MKLKIFYRCRFFLPGRAKDLSAPLYFQRSFVTNIATVQASV